MMYGANGKSENALCLREHPCFLSLGSGEEFKHYAGNNILFLKQILKAD